ncbi:MAG TPA: ATP-binding protein, partial [Pirellulales bacterium]
MEVFNWGPFCGLHRAIFDSRGTAIIGPTGSGKTTLVDALMTLLVGQPRYNLASTGGHESDRTLISYVRGELAGDGTDGHEEVLRPGKTMTGICATYSGGEQIIRLAGLLWTEGASNATDDLKRRWLFSLAEDQSLEQWLRLLHGDGIRDLMRMGRETADLQIFDSKKAYLARVRKFFEVGENAFTLLNRAAGLKQLNSIDEVFRELVLDDRSAFERALEVAGEFDNLAAIHAELETARRQQESLVPVAEEHQRLLNARKKAERFRTLKRIVPVWFAVIGREKWSEVMTQLSLECGKLQNELTQERDKEKACAGRVDTLRQRYLELGGDVIAELENNIELQKERVKEKSKHATNYRILIKPFKLSDELSAEILGRNQAWLRGHRAEAQQRHNHKQEEALAALSQQREQEARLSQIESTLRKVQSRPGSNIPPPFQDFRAELAAQLSLSEADLPFLAELVEVKPEETEWRGAIERAIGSERLRVLVPESRIDAALRWVNDRDNRLHVRLQRARQDQELTAF